MTAPQIVEFPRTSLADIPSVLRNMAANIETGDYGALSRCVVVIQAENGEIGIHGLGAGVTPSDAHLLLAKGQRSLEEMGNAKRFT